MSSIILVLGAGRSSSSLISWLLRNKKEDYDVRVGDISIEAALSKVDHRSNAISFDIEDRAQSIIAIRDADIVISMLPPHLHPGVAELCLECKKHLITASYVSPQMKAFDAAAKENDLLFLNECGLDPGIDHMSALQIIDRIKTEGGN